MPKGDGRVTPYRDLTVYNLRRFLSDNVSSENLFYILIYTIVANIWGLHIYVCLP